MGIKKEPILLRKELEERLCDIAQIEDREERLKATFYTILQLGEFIRFQNNIAIDEYLKEYNLYGKEELKTILTTVIKGREVELTIWKFNSLEEVDINYIEERMGDGATEGDVYLKGDEDFIAGDWKLKSTKE